MASLVLTGDVALQQVTKDLMGEGKIGKKIFRKGLRAGAKVVAQVVKTTFPTKTGKAAKSVKVKAMKRKKGRIGVRVALFAASPKGFPYPMGLEGGVKNQPKNGRIRKKVKKVTVNGSGKTVTDEAGSKAYHNLTWRIRPQKNVGKAFEASADRAQNEILATVAAELEKVRA